MSGIYDAFEPVDLPAKPIEQPPEFGFGPTAIGAGWKAGRNATDWGYNQSRQEFDIEQAFRTALSDRGVTPPPMGGSQARSARRLQKAGVRDISPWLRRAADDDAEFWRLVREQRRIDPKFMSEYADVVDSDSLSAVVVDRRKKADLLAGDVYDRASTGGKVAWWLGRLATGSVDPLSYGFGPVGSKAATFGASVFKSAGKAAAVNAAAAVATEPLVREDARRLGQERDMGDLAVEVGLSATIGAVLGGAEGALLHKFSRPAEGRKTLDNIVQAIGPDNLTPDEKAAVTILSRELDMKEANPFKGLPDGERIHSSRLAMAIASLEDGHPVPDFAQASRMPVQGRITSPFGMRSRPTAGASTNHRGVDIAAPAGAPVQATGEGRVIFAGDGGASGNTVRIQHADGVVTSFGHLSAIDVADGEIISSGQRIGRVGSTGVSTGNHVHYGVQVNGEWVDPMMAHIPGGSMVPGEHIVTDLPVTRETADMAMEMDFGDIPTISEDLSFSIADRQQALQTAVQSRILASLEENPKGFEAAALDLLDGGRMASSSVEARRKAILGRSHAMMEDVLANHRRRVTGQVRDPAGLEAIVRESFGQRTGNQAAREMAESWAETAEMLRQRFNRAGGQIGKLEGWGLPQAHSSIKVRRVPYEQWRDFTVPRLDRSRMIDFETGEPLSAQQLETMLRSTYDAIRTEGWSRRNPGEPGGKKLANQNAEHRFLAFRDPDAWLEYQREFGAGSPFDAMMGHISGMSRDIAMMEILGPNPAATLRWLQDTVQQRAAVGDGSGIDLARKVEQRLQEMFDTIDGSASMPVDSRLASFMQGTRAFLTSSLLGSASISAVSDAGFQYVTRRFNGLPAAGAIWDYAKMFRPWLSRDHRLAIRAGLIAEEASKMASAHARYIGETTGPEVASRMADFVLRVSGLSPWTQAGRWAFGMEFLGALADYSDRPLSKLPTPLRNALERYGFSAQDWTKIRQTPLYTERGTTFLRPADVADEALGDRILEMVLTEVDYAVPATTVRSRSVMQIGRPGTIMGEAARSVFFLKSFGISLLMTHGRRMMEEQGLNRLRYAAGLAVTTTLLGAVALQMKQVKDGKDPMPMNNPQFWGKALLQGGGLGIFGDFIGSMENRFGGSLGDTIAGPVAGAVQDVGALGMEATKDDPNFGKHVSRLTRRYVPGSSIWYGSLAFQRAMVDQMQNMIDPDADDAFARAEAYAERNGQDYWWQPGDLTPSRGPDWSNAFIGDRPD